MALYSPTNLIPNSVSKNANDNIAFEYTYNSTGTQTDHNLKIYKVSDNSLVYNSTKLTTDHNYLTLPSSTLTNGNIYKYQWEVFEGVSSVKSLWVLFYTSSPATLTLSATPTTSQRYEFSAIYNQSENVPLKTFTAELYVSTALTTPIATSGIIYPDTLVGNNDTISYIFDGMESDTTYSILFTGVTQYDEQIQSALTSFNILYNYPPSINTLLLTPNNNNGTMTLDWSALKFILGTVSGTYSYVSGKFGFGLKLNPSGKLYYNTETIPEDYTLYFWCKMVSGYVGTLLQIGEDNEDGMKLIFNNDRFGFQCGNYITCGRILSTIELAMIQTKFLLISVQYGKVIIKLAQQLQNISNTATTTESEYIVNVSSIILIANDNISGTQDLYISFDENISGGNYIVLRPGEQFTDLSISADKIYVQSSSGSVAFRFLGLTRDFEEIISMI